MGTSETGIQFGSDLYYYLIAVQHAGNAGVSCGDFQYHLDAVGVSLGFGQEAHQIIGYLEYWGYISPISKNQNVSEERYSLTPEGIRGLENAYKKNQH